MQYRQLIEHYAAGGEALQQAIAGLSDADFAARPADGSWSIGQIVLHLMDSDLIASDRMKRVIAEPNPPQLIGFDESAFAANLFYDRLNPRVAAKIFSRNRQLTTIIFSSLPESAFERFGMHNERGKVTLTDLVQTYAGHLDHHLKFLLAKRSKLGKPA